MCFRWGAVVRFARRQRTEEHEAEHRGGERGGRYELAETWPTRLAQRPQRDDERDRDEARRIVERKLVLRGVGRQQRDQQPRPEEDEPPRPQDRRRDRDRQKQSRGPERFRGEQLLEDPPRVQGHIEHEARLAAPVAEVAVPFDEVAGRAVA